MSEKISICLNRAGADLGEGCRGYNWYSEKKTMWFIGVEVEQETSAPPPKKNPGSAPAGALEESVVR